MKIGDLVVLSAYGKRLKLYKNRRFPCVSGIVMKKTQFAFHILWNSGVIDTLVDPKDIKIAKKV